jgi:uncharacterized protein
VDGDFFTSLVYKGVWPNGKNHECTSKSEGIRMYLLDLAIGLIVGVLVGFMGVGGGVILVPAMVHILHMDQHTAQGTSLFLQLPPLGLGALLMYRKKGQVDLKAGILCALGILLGGYLGSRLAVSISSSDLRKLFGIFLVVAAVLVWHKRASPELTHQNPPDSSGRLLAILLMSVGVGIASGLFGVGGGVLLVPLLVLAFEFDQHVAQGTSLVALVPPTGLLAFLTYASAGKVVWTDGMWIMPGVVLGGTVGAHFAEELSSRRLRRVVAVLILAIGAWEIFFPVKA